MIRFVHASVELTVVAHPVPGTIVRVDLSEGFRVPEIGKRRPCIVLSPPLPGRSFMCSIVPLSTSNPKKVCNYHTKLTFDPLLPEPYDSREMWVKGDIVLTVAFHRLRLIFSGWNSGQRVYDVRVLDEEILEKVRVCVLGLWALTGCKPFVDRLSANTHIQRVAGINSGN
jgi:mRNA interferase MazF